jgi:HSP20 family molecular chaperone IbpA
VEEQDMEKTRVKPNVYAAYDDVMNLYHIEIELPGVKKNDIDLKVLSGGFMVKAPKDNIEYVGDYTFFCPVSPDKTEAEYDNGLLTVHVPLKEPYEGATKIDVK